MAKRQIEYNKQIAYKKITDLTFDPKNPRLPESIDGSNESEVITWMLSNENILELMAAIGEKGFFPGEPLLVALNKKNKFEVIEGNRRLTAVKILNNPEIATTRKPSVNEIVAHSIHKPTELPVVVFKSADEVQSYLGFRHITGIQPWDSLAKARYLRRIESTLEKNLSLDEKYSTLAKAIGSRSNYVKLLLMGLDLYKVIEEKSFFKIKNLNEKTLKFGVLYTAINNPDIAAFIGINLDIDLPLKKLKVVQLEKLTRWIFAKNDEGYSRVGESRNLRLLAKIVAPGNEKALSLFEEGKPLRDAVLLTDEPDEIFNNSIQEALSKLHIAQDYIHLISKDIDKQIKDINEVSQLSKTMSATLRAKQSESEEE